jgi:hypothetical protein
VATPGAQYPIAVEYLDCNGNPANSPTPTFTHDSDDGLVAEIGQTMGLSLVKEASSDTVVPPWTCSLRVFARVTHRAFFSSAIGGGGGLQETARATARILPVTPTIFPTGLWPVTHWLAPGQDSLDCPFDDTSAPCTFWDSNSPPSAAFKEVLDLSHYSGLSIFSPRTQQQLFRCGLATCWDTSVWPEGSAEGNNDKVNDPPIWLRHGWRGTLKVDETDSNCQIASLACGNSELEIFQGDMGANYNDQMRDYICVHARPTGTDCTTPPEGTDPLRGNYATVTVLFWRYGEKGINPATNRGTVWSDAAGDKVNELQRVFILQWRRFRFYDGDSPYDNHPYIKGSSVRGHYVSLVTDQPPPCPTCPPSPTANTIRLTE